MSVRRLKEYAELAAGRTDGAVVRYEKFDPEDWRGENAKNEPAEKYLRTVAHIVGYDSKKMASETLRLIEHVQEATEALTGLVQALPVHDEAGRVIKNGIAEWVKILGDGPED